MKCRLRALFRIISFAILMTFLSLLVPLVRLFFSSKMAFSLHRQGMLLTHKILGIRLNIIGNLPTEPAMIMCNHPSYFDVLYNIGKHIQQLWLLVINSRNGLLLVG